ncbi:hypothetical protein FHS68_005331 [Dyadobacter arcticus]|uniref:Uncharacterized protein n=1 Tax=Dyadobacter arcticus TaxID=1078754 RepID=A0ABX0UT35_9BACT|nr:hypothetical protein [Dyadobacter arcticus]
MECVKGRNIRVEAMNSDVINRQMNKLPWTKYVFSLWIVAILAAITAKYITNSLSILLPLQSGYI